MGASFLLKDCVCVGGEAFIVYYSNRHQIVFRFSAAFICPIFFFLKKVGHSRPLFIYKQMFNKILPMSGVEPQTSGIESDRSTNWATTTSLIVYCCYITLRSV